MAAAKKKKGGNRTAGTTQLAIEIPSQLKLDLAARAKRTGRTLTSECLAALLNHLAAPLSAEMPAELPVRGRPKKNSE